MTSKNDGGPAFPSALYSHERAENWSTDGMTLRDWFAGQTAANILAQFSPHQFAEIYGTIAMHSYRLADAMLAERSK